MHTNNRFQWKPDVEFMKISQIISRTTGLNWNLFVLILMHFSCWFQIWLCFSTLLKHQKKSEKKEEKIAQDKIWSTPTWKKISSGLPLYCLIAHACTVYVMHGFHMLMLCLSQLFARCPSRPGKCNVVYKAVVLTWKQCYRTLTVHTHDARIWTNMNL